MLKKSLKWRLTTTVLTVAVVMGAFQLSARPGLTQDCLTDCVNQVLEAEQVSWVSWLTGRSSSYRFHFLDLLELLSRQKGQESE